MERKQIRMDFSIRPCPERCCAVGYFKADGVDEAEFFRIPREVFNLPGVKDACIAFLKAIDGALCDVARKDGMVVGEAIESRPARDN